MCLRLPQILALHATSSETSLPLGVHQLDTSSPSTLRRQSMRAIVQNRYGSADLLEMQEVEVPRVEDDQVLVRVHATSVHPDIWHVVHGIPYFLRLMGNGFFRPRRKIPGTDMSGVIESTGDDVDGLSVGDAVFGETIRGHQWKNGAAFAEYVAVPADALALKPGNVTFEQAASVPTSGLIAYRALRDEGRLGEGERVLINGAGGRVGTVALQIAKAHGATVTAVDSADKAEMLLALGADETIDYASQDFTTRAGEFDLIYDIPGNRSFADLDRALSDTGRYVYIGHDNFGRPPDPHLGVTMARWPRHVWTSIFTYGIVFVLFPLLCLLAYAWVHQWIF